MLELYRLREAHAARVWGVTGMSLFIDAHLLEEVARDF
jgi:hypothetical protein